MEIERGEFGVRDADAVIRLLASEPVPAGTE
jgi:hypothetical protein